MGQPESRGYALYHYTSWPWLPSSPPGEMSGWHIPTRPQNCGRVHTIHGTLPVGSHGDGAGKGPLLEGRPNPTLPHILTLSEAEIPISLLKNYRSSWAQGSPGPRGHYWALQTHLPLAPLPS